MNWISFASAVSGLILSQFGPVSELVQKSNPWYGFEALDAVLFVARAQHIENTDCSKWIHALAEDSYGIKVPSPNSEASWTQAWKAWDTWNKDDLSAVLECKDFPCAVKFNQTEVSEMAGSKPERRFRKFLGLVMNRAVQYGKTQERKEYEFPGAPVDPWKLFEKKGFVSSVRHPPTSNLWLRKVDFAPDQIRAIRQVLDRRVMKLPRGSGATVWVRDAYTDHYFDSWGEWSQISCDPAPSKGVTLVQALAIELDLLKKSDLISKIMHGKMKSAVEDNGYIYMNKAYQRMKSAVAKVPTTTQ